MSELKAQVNIRLNGDMNMSLAVTSIVQDEEESKEAGERDARLVRSYLQSFAAEIGDEMVE